MALIRRLSPTPAEGKAAGTLEKRDTLRHAPQAPLELGADPTEVHLATRSRKGYWRMSSHRIVQQALDYPYLKSLGLPSLRQLWIAFKYGSQAKA